MPIPATCQCGRQYMMKEEFAGQRAKCPECGRMVQVPALPPGSGPGGEPTPHVEAPVGMSGRKMLLIAGGVNLLCLVGLIFFIVWLNMDEGTAAYGTPQHRPAPKATDPGKPPVPAPATAPKTPATTPITQPANTSGTLVAAKTVPPTPVSVVPGGPKTTPLVVPTKPAAPPTPVLTAEPPTPVTPTPTPATTPTPTPAATRPVTPAVTPAAPAATAAGGAAVLKDDSNGGTMRMPVGQDLRVELSSKMEGPVFVAARLSNEDGKPVKELGQDKAAAAQGVYAWGFKGLEVGTAYFTVTFSDIDPAQGRPTKTTKYQLVIKVREGAPAGGRFQPVPPPRSRPPARE